MLLDVKPLVSIIVPTCNNETTIVRTLNSLIEQTLADIQIVVVDDASTDETLALCREAQRFDRRIVVVPLVANQTALQSRRIGVEHATGAYVMFCDGDDELAPRAAEEASACATGGGYEVVHFRTSIISTTGSKHGAWERSLDPFATELFGDDILLSSPFGQTETPINGNIWGKLYDKRLVAEAWKVIDPELRLPRAQDVYQTFLILANASRYAGLSSVLYRYNFGAGKSGNSASHDSFQHFLNSADTYREIKKYVSSNQWEVPAGFDTEEMLERLRDQFINSQLNYWFRLPQPASAALENLLLTWGSAPVLQVLAKKHGNKARVIAESFSMLDNQFPRDAKAHSLRDSQNIALLGNIGGSGGVQKVMAAQAEMLIRAGHSVTILSFDHNPEERMHHFPAHVVHCSLGPRGDVGSGVTELIRLIRANSFTLLLNHDTYSSLLPWVGAVTRTSGVASALFLHSFSLRAFYDFREVFGYLPQIARGYDITVTLSEADRMWWEASGVPRVRALPNFGPDSLSNAVEGEPVPATFAAGSSVPQDNSRVDLLWVGRLQDDTKNVSGLLEAFAQIIAQRPCTTLAIVGGEQRPGELATFERKAERLGIRDQVMFTGAVQDVEVWYRSAKVLLVTAAIEGFNLTLVEAQAFGLPVVMYELPYLETVRGNPGIISVDWGAAASLAEATRGLLENPKLRAEMGAAGREFARKFSLENYEVGLRSIVRELTQLHSSETNSTVSHLDDGSTVTVPVSVIKELYRLYEEMHRRTTSELQNAKRESGNLRKGLSQLKRSLAESKAKHLQVERAIAQIETKKLEPPKPKTERKVSSNSGVGGVWPLWARGGPQSFDPPSTLPFEDVSSSDPAAIPIAWALEFGLLTVKTNRLKGEEPVTRYEFISILHKLAGSPKATSEFAHYRDLDRSDPATAWAIERAILKPTRPKAGTGPLPAWNPDSELPRRSAAMLLYRAAGAPHYQAPSSSPYADLATGDKFYKEMCWAAHQGVLPPIRRQGAFEFAKARVMTRTQTVTALFRQLIGPLATLNRG